jgi:hypothetical protein
MPGNTVAAIAVTTAVVEPVTSRHASDWPPYLGVAFERKHNPWTSPERARPRLSHYWRDREDDGGRVRCNSYMAEGGRSRPALRSHWSLQRNAYHGAGA